MVEKKVKAEVGDLYQCPACGGVEFSKPGKCACGKALQKLCDCGFVKSKCTC